MRPPCPVIARKADLTLLTVHSDLVHPLFCFNPSTAARTLADLTEPPRHRIRSHVVSLRPQARCPRHRRAPLLATARTAAAHHRARAAGHCFHARELAVRATATMCPRSPERLHSRAAAATLYSACATGIRAHCQGDLILTLTVPFREFSSP
jgi:hypothetical protein